jgi:hypothetical protein
MAAFDRIGLAEWLQALRAELLTAQREGDGADLRFRIDAVEVEFEIRTSREGMGKGGVRFWVVEAGADTKLGSELTQRLRLTLGAVSGDSDFLVGDKAQRLPE